MGTLILFLFEASPIAAGFLFVDEMRIWNTELFLIILSLFEANPIAAGAYFFVRQNAFLK